MRNLGLVPVVLAVSLMDPTSAVAAARGRIVCEAPGTVNLVVQGSPNSVEAVGELRSLALPGGQRPLGLRQVVPLECSRAHALSGSSWKLVWYCYESENSDPAYTARIFTQDGSLQAVVSQQETGEAEHALYQLQCLSRD